MLPTFLCGYETGSHALRQEHRLIVFVNKVLRKSHGPKREEVPGHWRKVNIAHHFKLDMS